MKNQDRFQGWSRKALSLLATLALLALIVLGSLSLSACGGRDEDYPELSGQEAYDALENASRVILDGGDIDDVNTYSEVIADSQIAGEMEEKGLLFNSIAYQIDGEEQFYVKFHDYPDEDVTQDENYVTSTTYDYLLPDESIVGYAQERVLFHDDEDSWYVMVFLNADGTMKDCYLEANDTWMHDWATEGVTVYNMDREQIGTITLTLDNSLTNAFTIDMDLGEAGETLSAMDKTAIYWRCISEINDTYGD